jgi:hypothetical protein
VFRLIRQFIVVRAQEPAPNNQHEEEHTTDAGKSKETTEKHRFAALIHAPKQYQELKK